MSTTETRNALLRELVHRRIATRILVADDDPDIRTLIATPLRNRGFQVVEKADGHELLEYLGGRMVERQELQERNGQAPFIVVSDVRMPGCDGLTIVEGMRRWGWCVPVILISALDPDVLVGMAKRLDIAALFHKPFDPKVLVRFIEQMVDSEAS
jgi:CheY-like chemotaxis protein